MRASIGRTRRSLRSARSPPANTPRSTCPRRRRSTSGVRSSTRRPPTASTATRRPRTSRRRPPARRPPVRLAAGRRRRRSRSRCGSARRRPPRRVRPPERRPARERTTRGGSRCGARPAASANFDENSPNTRCSLRRRISPNVAASQNSVEPPLPRSTSHPSGRENSSVMPRRMAPTTDLTGSWRWEVPSHVDETSASAATAAGRTRDGPHPNRPSTGISSEGMRIAWRSTPVTVPA